MNLFLCQKLGGLQGGEGGETERVSSRIEFQTPEEVYWFQEKMVAQPRALTKITAFTLGALFARASQVYSAVIRPATIYKSTV